MSQERRDLIAAYGAEIVLTAASGGMQASVARALEIVQKTPGAWLLDQFNNIANIVAHELQTGPEIYEALEKAPDYFITGVGTGGTISGVAQYFKESLSSKTKFYAVEPADSPLISQTLSGEETQASAHKIQGIGANFIPNNLCLSYLDGAIKVDYSDALSQAKWMAKHEGLLAGFSSGANIAAIRQFVSENEDVHGKTIVTIAADSAERYLSSGAFVD